MRRVVVLLTDIFYLALKPFAAKNNKLRVLMYHRVEHNIEYDQLNVTPSVFEQQMACLAQTCQVVELKESLNNLKNKKLNAAKPIVAITFDDGYLDNYRYAIPILKKYNFPATFFITTKFTGQALSHKRYAGRADQQHMDWDQVKEIEKNVLFDIQSHTVSHPMLSEVSAEQSRYEIEDSKAQIEKKLDKLVDVFCFPNGNFTDREVEYIKNSGYQYALTVKPGANGSDSDWFQLTRTEVTNKDTPKELLKKISGAYDLLHKLLDWKRERAFAKRRALS